MELVAVIRILESTLVLLKPLDSFIELLGVLMTTIMKQTIMLYADPLDRATDGSRCLVQIHPLDLDQGPIALGDRFQIGRDKTCDLSVQDESVSRRHAEIYRCDEGYEIRDLGSTNGVVVNDRQVIQHRLATGDRIQLGSRIFRFLADHDLEAQYHETVYSMMTRDGLTGVYNKRYLLECLDREVHRCKRYGRPLAVILLDIDHFKMINDSYGHLAGDEVLQELACRLGAVLRDDEVLARFGGEEFAIAIVESDEESALSTAERCRAIIADKPFDTCAGPLHVTISLGVTAPPIDQLESRVALLSEADARLYEAKRGGRNQVVGRS